MYFLPHWRVTADTAAARLPSSFRRNAPALLVPVLLIILPVAWHNAKYDTPIRRIPTDQLSEKTSTSQTLKRLTTGGFVPISSTVGLNFYLGNHWELRERNDPHHPLCFVSYNDIKAEPMMNGIFSAAKGSNYHVRKTLRHMGEDPTAWFRLLAVKVSCPSSCNTKDRELRISASSSTIKIV